MLCQGCRSRQRRLGRPVCQGCWVTLPSGTRKALLLRDDKAPGRRLKLDRAIEGGTPLHLIEIR